MPGVGACREGCGTDPRNIVNYKIEGVLRKEGQNRKGGAKTMGATGKRDARNKESERFLEKRESETV